MTIAKTVDCNSDSGMWLRALRHYKLQCFYYDKYLLSLKYWKKSIVFGTKELLSLNEAPLQNFKQFRLLTFLSGS